MKLHQMIPVIALLFANTVGALLENGGFEEPIISTNWRNMQTEPSQLAIGWFGIYQLLNKNYRWALDTGQAIDLTTPYSSGYCQQQIDFEKDGFYVVTFNWGFFNNLGSSTQNYELIVTLDDKVVYVLCPHQRGVVHKQTFEISSYKNQSHILKFNQTKYNSSQFMGIVLDEITIQYDRPFPVNITSTALDDQLLWLGTLPKTMNGIKSLMFLVDDLWLYVYDDREYTGLMQTVFVTVQRIENIKWSFLNYYSHLPDFRKKIPISDYGYYSNPKYEQIEELDGSFARSVALFCTVTLPQTLVFCLILWRIFKCIYQHKLSAFIRRYYFAANYFQMVFEPNISYFTYIFFNQLKILFSFRFSDKAYIGFALIFWFFALIFGICFFFLVNEHLQKKSGYFLHNFYRVPKGLLFATIRINIRGFIYGILHSVLFKNYIQLIVCLTVIQLVIIVFSAYLEMTEKVYQTRTYFVVGVLYQFMFVILNLSLLYQQYCPQQDKIKGLSLEIQTLVLYCIAITTAIMIILDFLPIQWFSGRKREVTEVQENEKMSQKRDNEEIQLACIVNKPIGGINNKFSDNEKNKGSKQKKGEKSRNLKMKECKKQLKGQKVMVEVEVIKQDNH